MNSQTYGQIYDKVKVNFRMKLFPAVVFSKGRSELWYDLYIGILLPVLSIQVSTLFDLLPRYPEIIPEMCFLSLNVVKIILSESSTIDMQNIIIKWSSSVQMVKFNLLWHLKNAIWFYSNSSTFLAFNLKQFCF